MTDAEKVRVLREALERCRETLARQWNGQAARASDANTIRQADAALLATAPEPVLGVCDQIDYAHAQRHCIGAKHYGNWRRLPGREGGR